MKPRVTDYAHWFFTGARMHLAIEHKGMSVCLLYQSTGKRAFRYVGPPASGTNGRVPYCPQCRNIAGGFGKEFIERHRFPDGTNQPATVGPRGDDRGDCPNTH